MAQNVRPDWIAVDWGTTHLRAWALDARRAILATAESDEGMGGLERSGFEPALLRLVGEWLGDGVTPVLACGMVGSRQGWVEAPYATVPCPAAGDGMVAAPTTDSRLSVRVIPGIRQMSPPDVMRGEETQIAGFLARNPGFDGVVCLPGTHTKWVQVSAREIVSFQTFMTGELFADLSRNSILRHSVSDSGWDKAAFLESVDDSLAKPERMAARLFSLRAASLLQGLDGATARARLSGILIGAELAASRPYWLGQQVALIGAAELSQTYADALAHLGVQATIVDATDMTLAGLTAAFEPAGEHAS